MKKSTHPSLPVIPMALSAVLSVAFLSGSAKATDPDSSFSENLVAESSAQMLPPTELFVRWRPSATPHVKQEFYARLGLRKVWTSSLVPGLERLAPIASEREAAAKVASSIRELSVSRDIYYAQPNYRIHRKIPSLPSFRFDGNSSEAFSSSKPNDPMYFKQWALNGKAGIRAEDAWDLSRGSSNVKVAIIDTGMDVTNKELSDRIVAGYDFIDNTDKIKDTHGHGTHVSGIIGARTDNSYGIAGINSQVTFIPLRAVPNDSDETDANIISAFEFAAKAGARVANCSFGKAKSGDAVKDTILAAGKKGLLVIVAAGNDSVDNNKTPSYPANFHTENMLVVAASTASGGLAFFSNYGMGIVDLAAPGSGILSSVTNGQFASWSGTSMATPQVVGVAALVIAKNPNLTIPQVKAAILEGVAHEKALEGKVTTGGRLDARGALDRAAVIAAPGTSANE